jgi:hypothetical protein
MMLIIESDAMTAPIANARFPKKRISKSGVSARNSTLSRQTNAASANASGPTTSTLPRVACGNSWSAKTSDTMNLFVIKGDELILGAQNLKRERFRPLRASSLGTISCL